MINTTIEEFIITYPCGCKKGIRSDYVKIDQTCFKHTEMLLEFHKKFDELRKS